MSHANCAPSSALADTEPFPVVRWLSAVYSHHSRPPANQREALVALAVAFADPDTGEGRASIAMLMEFCGAARPTVQRALRWARRSDLLIQTQRGHRTGDGQAVVSAWRLVLNGQADCPVPAAVAAPPRGDAPTLPADAGTALYRWYDADDLLLYVGISGSLNARVTDHVKGSSWMDFAVRSTIERHPNREDASAAETEAIKTERPLFNATHNSTPEARRRLVEYLLEHGRVDLLAPSVGRG